jgi:tetratricopeptide (TPR) repeat protein
MNQDHVCIISEERAVDQIVETVKHAEPGTAPFALIVGSGFSHGLVPTARDVVETSLPLWIKSLDDDKNFEDLLKLPLDDRHAVSREFWKKFVTQNSSQNTNLSLNEDTGLPNDYSAAYRAVFNSKYSGALAPGPARQFQRAVMRLDHPRLNSAHFLLASLLGVQPGKTRRNDLFKARAAFCRLILTTNFDPFLQIALQSVNRLYLMSDMPELGIDDGILDEQPDAIHLVYLHGTIHRRSQAATDEEIQTLKHKNARILAPVLKRHGVIVIGYSGWDDAIVEALNACDQFDHRLFWCGRDADPLKPGTFGERVEGIIKKPTANYVHINGAGHFMALLSRRLVPGLPRLLDNPIGQLRETLQTIDLTELRVVTQASNEELAGLPLPSADEALAAAQRNVIERLWLAEQMFTGRKESPFPGDSGGASIPKVESLPARLVSLGRAAVALGDYEEGIKLFTQSLECCDSDPDVFPKALSDRGEAHYLFGNLEAAQADWSTLIDLLGAPVEEVAVALYGRGLTWGQKGDVHAEIADYSRVIELPGAPIGTLARALCNRATVRARTGDLERALEDFTWLIERLPGAPAEPVVKALRNRAIIWDKRNDTKRQIADYTQIIEQFWGIAVEEVANALCDRAEAYACAGESQKEIADYTKVTKLVGLSAERVAGALLKRARAWGKKGDAQKAIADCKRVIELQGASVAQVAKAANYCGSLAGLAGNWGKAVAEFTWVLELLGAPIQQVREALLKRGTSYNLQGDFERSIADYTRAIELPDASVDELTHAFLDRAIAWRRRGDFEKAIADSTSAIELEGTSPSTIASALLERAQAWGSKGDPEKAIADYSRVIELRGATNDQVARALSFRGMAQMKDGDSENAIVDYSRLIELPSAPTNLVVEMLLRRGLSFTQKGNLEQAIDDYTRVTEQFPDSSADQLSHAFRGRGLAWSLSGDLEKALEDYTNAIQMPGASANVVAQALVERGFTWRKKGDWEKATADYTLIIEQLPGASVNQVAQALAGRGDASGQRGDWEKAIEDYTHIIERLPNAPADWVTKALCVRAATWAKKGVTEKLVETSSCECDKISQIPICVTIGGPKIEGLELMLPTDLEFDAAARSLFKGNCDELLKLKPFLTIVSNRCDRTLVAYALEWKLEWNVARDEKSITFGQRMYPDAVAPTAPRRGNEIRPGEQKITAMAIEINGGLWGEQATEDFYLCQFNNWLREYKDALGLTISMDAAIFEDGEILGPNKSELHLDFLAYVDAKQGYYRTIVEGLDSGMSLDDAFAPIEAVAKTNVENPKFGSENVRIRWTRIAAGEVRSWRDRYGDEVAPEIYRSALRKEPFEIRGSVNRSAEESDQVLSQVSCPRCRYSPASADCWKCNCGHSWNTFDTRGLCPGCGYQWKETVCPLCGEMSPHTDWYLKH